MNKFALFTILLVVASLAVVVYPGMPRFSILMDRLGRVFPDPGV